jgi:hypothetical protein
MKKIIVSTLLSVFFLSLSANNTAVPLSDNAIISLLTHSPVDAGIHTRYGHTAIRVKDDSAKIDCVFNYGIFNFSEDFIYRFAKGKTDYRLESCSFKYEFHSFQSLGCTVWEQVLNLLPEEKETLWQALILNALPENCIYRYNFFFDNCATRPIVMIEKSIHGTVNYQGVEIQETFRHAINYLTKEYPWTTLGCDLVLGLPTDRVMTQKERLFLPVNLKDYLSNSVIIRGETSQPMVLSTNILAKQRPETEQKIPSPLACFTILFLILLITTWIERVRKKYFRIADCILFSIAGIAGCIIVFLSFFSEHPCMFPNINLLWLHPLHLIGVIFFSIKKLKTPAFWFHFINFAAISVMFIVWFFIPQQFNIAFIPLIASILLRSGWALLRKNLLIE